MPLLIALLLCLPSVALADIAPGGDCDCSVLQLEMGLLPLMCSVLLVGLRRR